MASLSIHPFLNVWQYKAGTSETRGRGSPYPPDFWRNINNPVPSKDLVLLRAWKIQKQIDLNHVKKTERNPPNICPRAETWPFSYDFWKIRRQINFSLILFTTIRFKDLPSALFWQYTQRQISGIGKMMGLKIESGCYKQGRRSPWANRPNLIWLSMKFLIISLSHFLFEMFGTSVNSDDSMVHTYYSTYYVSK